MNHNSQQQTGDGGPPPVCLKKRISRFLVAVILIVGFIYLAPNLERLPCSIGETITVLRESGIDVGAWYYDDVEECFEGMDFVREKRNLE